MSDPAEHAEPETPRERAVLICSFCSKPHTDFDVFIAAPTRGVFICSDCIELCATTLAEERARHIAQPRTDP